MKVLRHVIPAGTRHLYHADGRPLAIGDKVTSFRGEIHTVTGWSTNGHNRVYVKWGREGDIAEFFPTVFDLVWGPTL
jgi:hypothetical protein